MTGYGSSVNTVVLSSIYRLLSLSLAYAVAIDARCAAMSKAGFVLSRVNWTDDRLDVST